MTTNGGPSPGREGRSKFGGESHELQLECEVLNYLSPSCEGVKPEVVHVRLGA